MRNIAGFFLALATACLLSAGATGLAQADPANSEAHPLPRMDGSCYCPQVYEPVTCNGAVYSNACEARCAGAKNCEPGSEQAR